MNCTFSLISEISVISAICLMTGCEQNHTTSPKPRTDAETLPGPGSFSDPMYSTPFWSEGIENPQFVSAEKAHLPPETDIIGVEIASESFVFPLEKMSNMRDHVVNHVVAPGEHGTPFSVTYCDLTDCVRVLSSNDATNSLKIATVGRSEGQLMLQYLEHQFLQNESEIPLEDVAFERSTLSQWLEAHPDSQVYLGRTESD